MLSRISGQTILNQDLFATTPKSHKKFWADKFARNVAKDRKHVRRLRRMGWKVLIVWECQLRRPEQVFSRRNTLLSSR